MKGEMERSIWNRGEFLTSIQMVAKKAKIKIGRIAAIATITIAISAVLMFDPAFFAWLMKAAEAFP
ncbi:hypothetical protein [Thermoplasma volcanium]|uniref:hypothetical protein n=1 Tax=Thermoplasma volcanium TaxID=50339 RepID=UPI00064EA92D|nr:hypothetical protein [Thermoplasma volcanium]